MHPFVVYTSNHFHRRDRSRFQRKNHKTNSMPVNSLNTAILFSFQFNIFVVIIQWKEKKSFTFDFIFWKRLCLCVCVCVCVCVTQLTIYFNQYLSHSINNKFSIFFFVCYFYISFHYNIETFVLPTSRVLTLCFFYCFIIPLDESINLH